MRVFYVRQESPIWKRIKESFPIKDGTFIALDDLEFAALKEDLVVQQVGDEKIMGQHVRALAAHCECMAMNATNCIQAAQNIVPSYGDADYFAVLQKWGLINEEGEPLI